MKIIINNPYRVAGILSNSTEKDILKQKSKIKRFSEVGKTITSEYDFPFLDSLERSSNIIDKAFSDIEQNQNKITHSLFWFINMNPIDNTAIQHLISGNKEKAIEIWEKLTVEKEVNAKNFSAFNNIGTLYLLENSREKIKQGVTAKIKLIDSDSFKCFIQTVADETFTIDANQQIEKVVDELLLQIKNNYSTTDRIDLFSDCSITTQKYITQKFTEGPIHKIETRIEHCKNKRIQDASNALRLGIDLYQNTKEELAQLTSIIGATNLQYKMFADNIAKEILQCSIDYFNESQEQCTSNNYLTEAMNLAKIADNIAVNKTTKDRIKDNINTLEEMKDRELSQVIEFLMSVKQAYEENKRRIKEEVKKIEETDLLIKLGHKSINWDAVEDNIENSINWQKVDELLIEILSDKNLIKIKESNNIELKKEFLELANWMKGDSLRNLVKRTSSKRSSIISTIINKYKQIPPKLPFKIISSVITNTDKNNKPLPATSPLYKRHTRYVGLRMNIECLESGNITFYKKYIGTDGKLNSSEKVSPKGYTSSVTVNINTGTDVIDLSGWGNNDSCTYSIGKHRIEVYVDEYLIHSKEFSIDFSPSEKIEKQLKEAEAKLVEIKQRAFFRSEINGANDEMEEIKKFKLFRGNTERQRQIRNQQRKISELIENAENEKRKEIKNQEEEILKLNSDLLKSKY